MLVRFHGVRGSTPCHGDEIARYGGNTSCVSVLAEGEDPLLFDLGTGLRYFGLKCGQPFRGTSLVSHLHWDHVQGLPFFSPLQHADTHLTVYAPSEDHGRSAADVLASTIYKQYQAGFYGLATAGNVVLFLVVVLLAYPMQRFFISRELQL